ncbi:S-Ena type endospore appendage [Pontibacillus salicampi]|uniref:S-Ena type endospore appendage n=1 Tax=Pontibacillus salicampi TaxID=1449801 RepID=A0ABV6LQY2_9BACI
MNYRQFLQECDLELAPSGCPGIFPPKPTPPPIPPANCTIVKNEVCGNIEQPCDGSWVEYWSTIGLPEAPSGSLIVYNGSGCTMNVRAVINGQLLTILNVTERNQSKSVTVDGIEMIEVQCLSETTGARCSGRFCLTIQYPKICGDVE